MKRLVTLWALILLYAIPAQAGSYITNPKFTLLDDNGELASGACVYFYEPGTTTKKTIYTNQALSVAASNPTTLDSRGEASIFGSGTYKIVANAAASPCPATPDDITWTADNVGDLGGATVNTLATIAALRGYSFSGAWPGSASVQGYYAANDGAGGPPRNWVSGAAPGTYTDNGGSILVPTGGDGSAAWLGPSVYVWSVDEYGAKGDGATDDSTEIQAAIDYAKTSTGSRKIRFSNKNYAIATGIVINGDNVVLDCAAMQYFGNIGPGGIIPDNAGFYAQYGGTVWTWTGANGSGTMLQIAAPVAGPTIQGCGITGGLILDGDTKALKGLEILSHRGGVFGTIVAADCQTRQVELNVRTAATWTSADPADTQHNHFKRVVTSSWRTEASEGMLLHGDNAADSSVNTFDEIDYIHKDGIGLRLGSSGGNQLKMVFGFRKPAGTGVGVRLDSGSGTADDPVTNHFGWVQPGAGGFLVQGTAEGILPPKYTQIDAYSLGNGSPATPTVNYGGQLSYQTEWGAAYNSRTGGAPYYEINRVTNTNATALGQFKFSAYDDGGALQTYAYFDALLSDSTAGSEDGAFRVVTYIAGTATIAATYNDGFTLFTGSKVKFIKRGLASLNFGSIAANGYEDLTIAVVGATTTQGAVVTVGLPSTGGAAGISYSAFVSAADVVTLRATNCTTGAIDPAAETYSVLVTGF
jgi:hypothetical protein